MKKIILYELNEISPRLLEYYIRINPKSNLARIVKKNGYFKTHTTDNGELHPWSTWPTVHRGVNNQKHNIRFINQDLNNAKDFPPIWEILEKNNISIGVFGSLQSFPPLNTKKTSFYIPDTFAPSHECHPKYLEAYQQFNLSMTSRNKGLTRGYTLDSIFKFLKLIKNIKLSFFSLRKIIQQVFLEFLFKRYKTRRSLLQPIIGFDIFLRILKNKSPHFATFFTNHVAGMQHKYWGHLFPGETVIGLEDFDIFHFNSIIYSLNIAENQLKKLQEFSEKNNYAILILSSMGQDSIKRKKYIPELYLENLNDLTKNLGLNPKKYILMPAMQPDISIKCADKESLEKLLLNVKFIIDSRGLKLLRKVYDPIGLTLNLSLERSKEVAKSKKLSFKGKVFQLKQFGFSLIELHPGTGYHIPEGIIVVDDEDLNNKIRKKYGNKLDTRDIAPIILEHFKIKTPEYMAYH